MKTFLQKLFGLGGHDTNVQSQELPPPPSMRSLREHQRESAIEWVASRMRQLLQTECREAGALTDDEKKYLIYLASCLIEWVEKDLDVYLSIKEMPLSDKHHKYLLKVYEEVKEEIRHCFPPGNTEPMEQHEDEAVWRVYRDVLHAVTQKKFLLIREGEVSSFRQGDIICEAIIKERSDIPRARDLAKLSLLELGVSASSIMSHLLLISEAITNVLKHANEGKLTIVDAKTSLHVLVEDTGPGFPLKILPYTTLMAGYSTKKSLGQGFTLMMKMAEQVLLSTSSRGSTLILVFHGKEGAKHESIV
ncbi:ATP-binding protein [Paenibacillus cremeus]|uniref:ATP-binding protein n=1 Tax=Paenibacillus cremeus TaxID=2163881 RepID=A0A559K7H1_9BACL|nr:ATP-binding protein [Paenibacillus cremeus]TVY08076.1 ATP-binding protein [Paenibacillus cremeus]